MNNSNIIVSIIIVLSIAAGVTVYGLNEGDNAVFSDLTGFTPASSDSGSNGLGDLISNDSNQQNSGMNGVSSPSSSGSSSSGSSSSGSSSNGGSGSGSSSGGSGSGSGSGSGGGSSSGPNYSSSQIRSIANSHIGESGCYAGTPSYSGGYWYVTIYNSTDNSAVDGFVINDRNGFVSRG